MVGADIGTFNLVVCRRDEKGNFIYKREVNAFIELPLENPFVFNMMKSAGVPLIEREDAGVGYALGEAAVNMAYTMSQIELKRPMKNGCLNPQEKHAQQILGIMIHSLIEAAEKDGEVLYYCVPANAINDDTDAEYHDYILKAIFDSFEDKTGKKVQARPINEALALIYAEMESKAYTGVGVSCGAGMVNVCFAQYGNPNFKFSIVNSGDWIDRMAAKATGESPTFINKEKNKLDLTVNSDSLVQRAIKAQYEIMVQRTTTEIKKGFDEMERQGTKIRVDHPLDVVVAGGTATPKGFEQLFESTLRKVKLPVEIGKVIKPVDPLYSVARGCLRAAEAAGN